jgi:hypothetical protein
MNMNGSFDPSSGVLLVDGQPWAAPDLRRSEFVANPGNRPALRTSTTDGHFLAGPTKVVLWGHRFTVGLTFVQEHLHSATLSLPDGKVATLGYDADEKDLLQEKKMLTALLTKQLGRPPSQSSLGSDAFEYGWGAVMAKADLKSTWAGVEIRYLASA